MKKRDPLKAFLDRLEDQLIAAQFKLSSPDTKPSDVWQALIEAVQKARGKS